MTIGTHLQGLLEVRGSINKTTAGEAIGVIQNVTGQIRVYGSLYDDPNAPDEINVRGAMPFPGAIAIDWDGNPEYDWWYPGAKIVIGSTEYTGNDPQARVYEISPCRGDMDNTGAVNGGDESPFNLALTFPSQYALAYPGLSGSMVFHGDSDCNGTFDGGDINSFNRRTRTGFCECWRGMDEPPPLPPPQLAAFLTASVPPEEHGLLVDVAAIAVEWQPTDDLRDYWQAVYDALTQ